MSREFIANRDGLVLGLELLLSSPPTGDLPKLGIEGSGEEEALSALAGAVLGGAARLDDPGFFAHMDPATPWITWVAAQWAARLNQNLLHPDTGAVARELEGKVIATLAPIWGMDGGHMVPGSTVANLTALWVARDLVGVTEVVSSEAAHLSVSKAAQILGLAHRKVPVDADGSLSPNKLGDISEAAIVLTAGTTDRGAIDPLSVDARWVHVDAAWAGPLKLSDTWSHLLSGIENADSVAVSAHKWLYQPKESALVLFADTTAAHDSVSFGGDYLAAPNVGLLGSHGFSALPLAATILAYGLSGMAAWVDHGMELASRLADAVDNHPELEQLSTGPGTGVVLWRHREVHPQTIRRNLEKATVSLVEVNGEPWLRSVAANPLADPMAVIDAVLEAARHP